MSTNPPQFEDDDPLSWFDLSGDDDASASSASSDSSGSAGVSDSAPSWLKDPVQFTDDQESVSPPWFSDAGDLDLNLDSVQPAAPSPSQRAAPDETLPAEPRRTERKRTGDLSSPALPAAEPAAEPASSTDDAPDWFAGLDLDQVAEPAESVEPISDDFMPDWMFSDEAAPAQGQPVSDPDRTIADEGDEDDVPSWMREMNLESSAAKAVEAIPAADEPPASGSEFGWLNEIDLSSSIAEASAGTTGLTPSKPIDPTALPSETKAAASTADPNSLNLDELSHISSGDIDKLLNLSLPAISTNPSTVGDFAPPLPSTPVPDSGFDFDSLSGSGSSDVASTSGLMGMTGAMRQSQQRKPKPQDDLDDLFGDAVLGDEVFNRPSADVLAMQDVDLQGDAPTLADAPSSTGLTGMLSRRNLPPTPVTPPTPAPTPAQEEALRDFSSDADVLPEWVADLRPADAPITLSVGDQVIKVKEEPIGKLPEQVKQLRERAKEFRVSEAKSVAPLSGPLAGITGAINPVSTSVTPPPASQSALRSPLKDTFSDRVKILQNMLKSEDEFIQKRRMEEAKREELEAGASGVLPAPRARSPIKPDRLLIAALLLAIIVFPFLYRGSSVMPTLGSVAETANVAEPHFQQVAQAISSLQRDQRILVAFEYAPTGAAEMDEMAKAILTDVMARGVHPVIVSTNPAGALHAYTLIDQLGRETELRSVLKRTEPFQAAVTIPSCNIYRAA
ncbi:MAG: hypothetical protein U0528_15595 [Anaerolineae bacterium]